MEDITVNGSFSQLSNASNLSEVVPFVMAPAFVLRISNTISISALILNVIHIAVVASMPKTKCLVDSNFKKFTIHLSAVNIVMMAVRSLLDFEQSQFFLLEHRTICVLSATIVHSQILFSGWLLLLVSVERLIAISSPHDYTKYFYTQQFGWALALAHIATVGVYVVVAVVYWETGFSVKGSGCCQMGGPGAPQLGMVSLGQGFPILFVISVLYTILLCKGRQALSGGSTSKMSVQDQKRAVVLRRLNITFGAIVYSKVIGWLPIMVLIILRPTPYANLKLDYVSRISLHFSSIMSPIAYGAASSKYRKYVIKMFRRSDKSSSQTNENCEKINDQAKKLPEKKDSAAQDTVATLEDTCCYDNQTKEEDSTTSFDETQSCEEV